jgi:hypothetical protein
MVKKSVSVFRFGGFFRHRVFAAVPRSLRTETKIKAPKNEGKKESG